ncbi:MAG: DUF4159 domain-containing protein [Bacteroidales bacterium]|jgi:hypothetical protein|nr:DUF4159 domain-containing protein [Bacteroidales bacterium]MDI9575026.1 DUF4159 domain-containing protein [Bacteroidota bacterium]HPZ74385.1 DUF4159 domain-containing protein [Candidatus Pacearchaeota archaeon]MDD2594091.1 DUF4159 domain-containing protein [Bacteroidales bacterium]MDD3755943.1 DUF4159 domain-containing protein [Bacteroidales bacterium]
MKKFLIILLLLISNLSFAQRNVYSIKIALLKYSGGGDWYANPTSLPNLAVFCNQNINTNIDPNIPEIEPGSQEIFNYPFIHMTGHGNVIFSDNEAANIRKYLEAGGFLHIDDNYGMDPFIRPQIQKIFPDLPLQELPPSHPIFSQVYNFSNGLPKIHEHDSKPPQAFGIILNGRLVLLYTYECDLGDGWESEEVHNDPPEIRLKALQMGANIIHYAFNQ